jgi:signal transduction histidine kinase
MGKQQFIFADICSRLGEYWMKGREQAHKKARHSASYEANAISLFPTKGVVLLLLLTGVIFFALGLYGWQWYEHFRAAENRTVRLIELNGVIIHLDEVLTMSAKMAAATGNLEWENRYRNYEPQLDNAIKEAMNLSSATFLIDKNVTSTDAANIALVTMENKAFDLMREGNRQAAMDLLYSREYEEQKRVYNEGMESLITDMQEHMRERLDDYRWMTLGMVVFVSVVVSLLVFEWFGMVQVHKRLTERRQAEEKQVELLEQVEAINEELKDFAHIVSHDLKAPLRGIKQLVEWISTDYADKLGEAGREQMNLLSARAERMHNLIDGVLQYSKVGRIKEEPVAVNVNKLVLEVIDMLAPPEKIAITIANELPIVECEKTRIIQIFENLLSNAIKYMDKREGRIEVSCVGEDGFWKFSVADNGCGIEEEHFEKIFGVFQVLSPRDEIESTGIGLSVVKKIVDGYGGRIWVESKPGEGSTFFFTLPRQEMEAVYAKIETDIAC